ncbi:MAG TPA: DUF4388 domain-containing protein [Acidimicrobiales bacterium]|nr:DUF4388 domain-containing protein [Acidimicrobiales bacterium]
MPFQGTFDVLDFSAVLELVAARNMSGRLHVRSRSFAANLFFDDGYIVGADQSEHSAAASAGDVGQRAQEICFELLGTDRGSFEFHLLRSKAPAGASISVKEAMEQARQRLAEWQELQALIPSLDVQPRLVTELDPGQVTLDRDQWRVLTAVDGRRNLRSIGRALNLSDFEVCRAMRELLNAKVIELDLRPLAGIGELEAPLATEHVTINGKRATRVRAERAHSSRTLGDGDEEPAAAQTIVISPNRPHRQHEEPKAAEAAKGPEAAHREGDDLA